MPIVFSALVSIRALLILFRERPICHVVHPHPAKILSKRTPQTYHFPVQSTQGTHEHDVYTAEQVVTQGTVRRQVLPEARDGHLIITQKP